MYKENIVSIIFIRYTCQVYVHGQSWANMVHLLWGINLTSVGHFTSTPKAKPCHRKTYEDLFKKNKKNRIQDNGQRTTVSTRNSHPDNLTSCQTTGRIQTSTHVRQQKSQRCCWSTEGASKWNAIQRHGDATSVGGATTTLHLSTPRAGPGSLPGCKSGCRGYGTRCRDQLQSMHGVTKY